MGFEGSYFRETGQLDDESLPALRVCLYIVSIAKCNETTVIPCQSNTSGSPPKTGTMKNILYVRDSSSEARVAVRRYAYISGML